MRLGCPHPIAPFAWQPGRGRLRGLASFGVSYGAPIGAGVGTGAEVGASQGASIGSSIVPGIGTAIGAVVGAIGGAIAGSINKKDPEQYNFDAAVALWQQNPDAIYNIGNKYLVLAGLFDLNLDKSCSSRWCIPMYVRYGRMGEQRFVNDFVMTIYTAAQNGQIVPTDTPATIMARIVQPWINSWGYGPLNDPHADLINRLLTGMVWDYTDGSWKTNWRATGGDFPFGNLPMFALPQAAAPTQPTAPAAAPVTIAPAQPVTTTAITPVGSSATTSVQQTPAQLVAYPPPVGTLVSYAPDQGQGGAAVQVPAGLTFVGTDPYNGSWILSSPTGKVVLWQGVMLPYSATMFAPIPASTPTVAPVITVAPTTPVATTSTGATVTQADLQNLANQVAAQGASAQQAYASVLQTLQNNGVAATPQVQNAVQSAVQSSTPTGLGGLSGTTWLIIAGFGFLLLSGRRH